MDYDEFTKLPTATHSFHHLYQIMRELRRYDSVDIHRERDFRAEQTAAEDVALWEVRIDVGLKRVCVERRNLLEALITAAHEAEQVDSDQAKQLELKKAAALAKARSILSEEEMKLVGIWG